MSDGRAITTADVVKSGLPWCKGMSDREKVRKGRVWKGGRCSIEFAGSMLPNEKPALSCIDGRLNR